MNKQSPQERSRVTWEPARRASRLCMGSTQCGQGLRNLSGYHCSKLRWATQWSGMILSTRCCGSHSRYQGQSCSVSGLSRPTPELTVSNPTPSFKRPDDRDTDDGSQDTADIAPRPRAAMKSQEQQLEGRWLRLAAGTDRMSAGPEIQLALLPKSGLLVTH
jgi:hypothetical protein